jgi:hypothetical protein
MTKSYRLECLIKAEPGTNFFHHFSAIRVTNSVAGLSKLKIRRITRHAKQLFTAHMLKDSVSTSNSLIPKLNQSGSTYQKYK